MESIGISKTMIAIYFSTIKNLHNFMCNWENLSRSCVILMQYYFYFYIRFIVFKYFAIGSFKYLLLFSHSFVAAKIIRMILG